MVRVDGRETRGESVQGRLRRDILSGHFRPRERLKFPQLSERYGVSTGAVREALLRLTAAGLVTSQAHLGFQVAGVTQEGLAMLCDARAEIESLVIRRSVTEGDLAWQSRVVAAHHVLEQTPSVSDPVTRRPEPEWLAAHVDFHNALLAGCRNPWLRNHAHALRDEAELYRRWSAPSPADMATWTPEAPSTEHRDLLQAALDRDPDAAERVLRRIIGLTAALVVTVPGTEDAAAG